MSGDRLAQAEEWVRLADSGDPAAYDGPPLEAVRALVEIAKQARAELRRRGCLCLYSRCPIHGESTGALAAALARLDSEEE